LLQLFRAGDDLELFYLTGFADYGVELHFALDPGFLSVARVDRGNIVHDLILHDVRPNGDGAGGVGRALLIAGGEGVDVDAEGEGCGADAGA